MLSIDEFDDGLAVANSTKSVLLYEDDAGTPPLIPQVAMDNES
jgi:hypothetical protein